jgi:dCTP deaminase
MILSNTQIQAALDNKWLVIDPEPLPRRNEGDVECPYHTSSVDLRLGNEISHFRDNLKITIDLAQDNFADLFGTNSQTHALTAEKPFVLKPGMLVLGRTLERIELPLITGAPCLAARVEGRSSFARCGLLVHFSAPTIHAGFCGSLTLELINLGPIPIILRAAHPICQLIVEQVDGVPFRNDSQFHGQQRAGGRINSGG